MLSAFRNVDILAEKHFRQSIVDSEKKASLNHYKEEEIYELHGQWPLRKRFCGQTFSNRGLYKKI